MTFRSSLTTAALIAGALLVSAPNAHAEDDWGVQVVTQGNNALAVEMYRELVAGSDDGANVFFSPMSISAALSLTYEGARGETMQEFEHILGVPSDAVGDWGRPQYHEAMGEVLGLLGDEDKPYELAVANSLWGEQSMPFRQGFIDALGDNYDAGLELVDFQGDFERQRVRINGWVADRTHDRIENLLPDGSLNGLTRLVLVNAIYFKAQWATPFQERATQDAAFHLLPTGAGESVEPATVPMMHHHEKRFAFADLDGFSALELPYERGDLSMVVLLPDEVDGLPELEASLSPELLAEAFDSMGYETANVWLPRWEMTLDYDLIPALQQMGMEQAFDDSRADFTGITDSAEGEKLCITGVFHKAFIAVDEHGTEAAAATAVVVGLRSAPRRPDHVVDFRADHSFIYLIRDNRSGAILFMGQVTDPS